MKEWYVVHTQPMKELIALQHLSEQGFQSYLPRYRKTRRHARKTDTVLVPLFPRYLFVSLDLEASFWRSVNGTRGVAYMLTCNERPSAIAINIIENLKAREDAEGLVPIDTLALFMQGDKVRILEGAFEGYSAVFQKMDEKARVQLLLNFLGRETKVSLSLESIEAA